MLCAAVGEPAMHTSASCSLPGSLPGQCISHCMCLCFFSIRHMRTCDMPASVLIIMANIYGMPGSALNSTAYSPTVLFPSTCGLLQTLGMFNGVYQWLSW